MHREPCQAAPSAEAHLCGGLKPLSPAHALPLLEPASPAVFSPGVLALRHHPVIEEDDVVKHFSLDLCRRGFRDRKQQQRGKVPAVGAAVSSTSDGLPSSAAPS